MDIGSRIRPSIGLDGNDWEHGHSVGQESPVLCDRQRGHTLEKRHNVGPNNELNKRSEDG